MLRLLSPLLTSAAANPCHPRRHHRCQPEEQAALKAAAQPQRKKKMRRKKQPPKEEEEVFLDPRAALTASELELGLRLTDETPLALRVRKYEGLLERDNSSRGASFLLGSSQSLLCARESLDCDCRIAVFGVRLTPVQIGVGFSSIVALVVMAVLSFEDAVARARLKTLEQGTAPDMYEPAGRAFAPSRAGH